MFNQQKLKVVYSTIHNKLLIKFLVKSVLWKVGGG